MKKSKTKMRKTKRKRKFLERRKNIKFDVLLNIVTENLQDTFSETVGETVIEHQNKDKQEAEEMANEELKSHYLSELISHYKYLVGMTAALKKDPVHQRITRTAKRLREEEDYDDESMQYAIKKRKFLIEQQKFYKGAIVSSWG